MDGMHRAHFKQGEWARTSRCNGVLVVDLRVAVRVHSAAGAGHVDLPGGRTCMHGRHELNVHHRKVGRSTVSRDRCCGVKAARMEPCTPACNTAIAGQ
jgi:hypothetical protein